jgi:hypothetical protein
MNVLRYLPSDENAVTTLLRALCVLKPIREAVVRLFTQGHFGADDVEFEAISTQVGIGGAIPDMCFHTNTLRVAVEIKVFDWRELTANQPQSYLRWLVSQPADQKFFVFLVHHTMHIARNMNDERQIFMLSIPIMGFILSRSPG